jgi:hypothetical protein
MIKKYVDFINESKIKNLNFPNEIVSLLPDIKLLNEIKYIPKKELISQKVISIINNKQLILIENKIQNQYLLLLPKTQNVKVYYFDGNLHEEFLKNSQTNQDLTLLFSRMYEKDVVNMPNTTNFINTFNPNYNILTVYTTKTKDQNIERFDYVQVKIDKHVSEKVDKLVYGMGFNERSNLRAKISFLSDPLKWKNSPLDPNTLLTVQNKISAIILLDYLAEIKENFNPTTSGFLFESFFAGIIGGHVVDDNTKVDVYLPGKGPYRSKNYQLKLFDEKTLYDLNKKSGGKTALQNIINGMPIGQQNFIFIGLKRENEIETYLIPLNEEFEELIEREGFDQPKITPSLLRKFKKHKAYHVGVEDIFQTRTIEYLGTLKFGDFTSKINSVKKDLGDSLKETWESIKKLHDEVEGMVTGVSSKRRKLKDKTRALKQSKIVDTKINNLYNIISSTEEKS